MSDRAEQIRRDLADAWGEMGAAWGVAPAIARIHMYLLSSRGSLTEREIREALRLSHRATSLALADAEAWGIVQRVSEPRRVGKRGPAGTAYAATGDHWRWFSRVIAERKAREGDPVVAMLAETAEHVAHAAAAHPDDPELSRLRDWLATFLVFVRLFDRAIGLVPKIPPPELERALRAVSGVSDETALRLFTLLAEIPDAEVVPLLDSLSRLSPSAARRATRLFAGVLRRLGR